jgi:hypothetical protein
VLTIQLAGVPVNFMPAAHFEAADSIKPRSDFS